MGTENRVPPSAPTPPRRSLSPPFYRVDQRGSDGRSHHYVVHTQSPTFLVEFDAPATAPGGAKSGSVAQGKSLPVIRRVCVPNNWAGDYHQCARQLAAAAEFFAATTAPDEAAAE